MVPNLSLELQAESRAPPSLPLLMPAVYHDVFVVRPIFFCFGAISPFCFLDYVEPCLGRSQCFVALKSVEGFLFPTSFWFLFVAGFLSGVDSVFTLVVLVICVAWGIIIPGG